MPTIVSNLKKKTHTLLGTVFSNKCFHPENDSFTKIGGLTDTSCTITGMHLSRMNTFMTLLNKTRYV